MFSKLQPKPTRQPVQNIFLSTLNITLITYRRPIPNKTLTLEEKFHKTREKHRQLQRIKSLPTEEWNHLAGKLMILGSKYRNLVAEEQRRIGDKKNRIPIEICKGPEEEGAWYDFKNWVEKYFDKIQRDISYYYQKSAGKF